MLFIFRIFVAEKSYMKPPRLKENFKKNRMKQIEAIIRKSKFDDVKEALHQIEVNFFSYWDVNRGRKRKAGSCISGNFL